MRLKNPNFWEISEFNDRQAWHWQCPGWEVADFFKKLVAADCPEPSCLWGVSAPWLAGWQILLYFVCLKSNA